MTRTYRERIEFKGPVRLFGGIEQLYHVPGGAAGGAVVTPGVGVAVATDEMRLPRHLRLTFADFAVAILADDDYGGAKILDLPDTNLLLLACEADLTVTKGNKGGGLGLSTPMTVGIGTAIASAATLSGAMVDVMSGAALATDTLTPTFKVHTNSDGSISYPIKLADSATSALYLNIATSITSNDDVTVDGSVDLFFLDLGNATS